MMKNEEIGYIECKKNQLMFFPDSICFDKKKLFCQPRNLGHSMDFIDYTWDQIEATFVKENILGSEFSVFY
jgi:hypothetical protein